MRKFTITFIISISILFITSLCKEDNDKDIPECEKNNTGDIKITNNTSFGLYIDITLIRFGSNYERYVKPKENLFLYRLEAGRPLYCYAADSTNRINNIWYEEIVTLTRCKTYELVWTIEGKGNTFSAQNFVIK